MTIWKNCFVDELTYGESDVRHFRSAQVKIGEGCFVVTYTNDEGKVDYRGDEKAPGHFKLISRNKSGEASLHRFPGGIYLEGYWKEEGYEGFWRIKLKE